MNDTDIKILFGYNLKRLRKQNNMSQLELAVETGMALTFISNIEKGKKWISPESISKFSTALHAEPYQFFLPENYIQNKKTKTQVKKQSKSKEAKNISLTADGDFQDEYEAIFVEVTSSVENVEDFESKFFAINDPVI